MSRNTKYTSLLRDESFSGLNVIKVRRLVGLALSETLGTAFFVFLGCGNVVASITGSDTSHLNTALSFAFGIGGSIAMFGHISGAIMNPALNFALVILGHFSILKLLYYTIYQLLGAYLGVFMVGIVTPDLPQNFCVVAPSPDISLGQAITVEFIITSMLTFALCSVVDSRKTNYSDGIYMKFSVVILAIALPSAKYTGCAMNPARAFGPALMAGNWENHWLYWIVPIVSSSATAFVYRAFFDQTIFEETNKRNSVQMT